MPKQIWKFPLEMKIGQTVTMPLEAKILTAQMQNETPTIWAEVDTKAEMEGRVFSVYGTGWDISSIHNAYIATCQSDGLVWHIYEELL